MQSRQNSGKEGDDMTQTGLRLGACGLDCRSCDLYLLPTDTAVQDKLLPWFRSRGWLRDDEDLSVALQKGMYCKGCGHHETWWSPNCTIAKCCIHENGYHNCSMCGKFLCKKLVNHQSQDEKYQEGITYLQRLVEKSAGESIHPDRF